MATPSIEFSPYRQPGGRVAITAVVDDFSRRIVDDPALALFFAGIALDGIKRRS
jgi:hypothetical protein